MEKKAFRWIAVLLFLAVAAGCAEKKAYAPVDVMPNVRAAGQVQCIDNFVVLFDRSDSMNAFYQPAGMSRLAFEKKTVSEMVDTIPPDIKLNGALRFFGAEKVGGDETTWLVLGRTSFNKAEFQAALEKNVKRGLGRTPIGRALAGARGQRDARIFVRSMQAELLSIAGIWRTLEQDLPAALASRPLQVLLESDKIVMRALPD